MGCLHTHTSWSNIMQLSLPSQQLGDVFAYTFKRHTPEPGRESHANTHTIYPRSVHSQRAKRDRPTTMYDFTHTHAIDSLGNIALGNLRAITSLCTRGNIGFMSFGRSRALLTQALLPPPRIGTHFDSRVKHTLMHSLGDNMHFEFSVRD
jgi:hypothetical protein